MGTTLTNNVYLPDEGERNCYSGLAQNWQILDDAVGAIAGKANASHTHGNITNAGAIGSTSGLPVITGTDGVLTTGTFGNTEGTFCEGNDSRLSDARTPVAHTHGKADITDLFNSTNEWTGSNVFQSPNTNLALRSTTSELGSLTSSSNWLRWLDKNGAQNSYISRDVWNDGADTLRIAIVGKRANGAPSTSGTETDCGVRLNIEADGTKSFTPFDNNINLGTSTNQWNNLYAKNYYYNGVAWGLDKNNTWSANNIFSGTTKLLNDAPRLHFTITSQTGNTAPSSNTLARIQFNGSTVDNFGNLSCEFLTTGENRLGYQLFDISKTKSNVIQQRANSTTTTTIFTCDNIIPATTDETELGTSSKKWKTLNGINPGALGFPGTTPDPISTDGWNTSGGRNIWAPTLDGWLYIRVTGGSDAFILIRQVSGSNSNPSITAVGSDNLNNVSAIFPVVANRNYYIYIHSTAIEYCEFIPCLGNVTAQGE